MDRYDILGTLLGDIEVSSYRWLAGLALGALAAALFGGLYSASGLARRLLLQPVDFLRAVPVIALVPIVQWCLGPSEIGKIWLIAWASFFPVVIVEIIALSREVTEAELVWRAIGIGRWRYLSLVKGPQLIEGLIQGIRVAIGVAWISVVAAELTGTYNSGPFSGGLGYRIFSDFYQQSRWDLMLLYLFTFGLLGFGSARLFDWALVWMQKSLGFWIVVNEHPATRN